MNDPVSVPLGFWLRAVDSLFESSMDEVLSAQGVTRRLWQVLNSVKRNEPASTKDVDEAMAMFLENGESSSMALLRDIAGRGWADESGASWRLTNAGRSALTGLENEVAQHREVMFRGVADAEYRTTVETLARITNNLDPKGTLSAQFR